MVRRRAHVVLKKQTEAPLSLEELQRRWKQLLGSYHLELQRDKNKVLITASDDKQAIVLNEALRVYSHCRKAMIGKGQFWPDWDYGAQKPYYKTDQMQHEWTVDVYGDELLARVERTQHENKLIVQPRHYKTVALCMKAMEKKVKQWLQLLAATKPTSVSDADVSVFQLTINRTTERTNLTVPKYMSLTFSSNLNFLLGYNRRNEIFVGKETFVSERRPSTLDELEQELFIYTDIVEETNYGDDKVTFLHHFLHNYPKTYCIVQQSFKPIVYLPLLHNFIGSITIKLLTSWRECVKINDSKTLLVLQFRRRKSQ